MPYDSTDFTLPAPEPDTAEWRRWLLAQWIDTLRSGGIKQSFNWKMDAHGGRCPLAILEGLVRGDMANVRRGGFLAVPSPFPGMDTMGAVSGAKHSVVFMNDRRRLTFGQMADYLEANASSILGETI